MMSLSTKNVQLDFKITVFGVSKAFVVWLVLKKEFGRFIASFLRTF